ncbi:hypothetical protein GUITHDRAFT_155476 [Guillardia theta CCMP2712]|uniref:Uncharacterized protein n=2 Tax=Guillardia theta TaxID=55529 RepID=L1IGY5_GUITC|nr:hypothetical protein GUITHDRAFT_155476 [Guillardia theta CCMP2712]EKX35521.1 hypothetical protein GUITHDRAFT_155476 [Guillardia theta CCMP2712]|eukprot:XP_005822501.1 hypothetical protein GUITHDRAFT_155476 [Guillardia theta CCMP2712]
MAVKQARARGGGGGGVSSVAILSLLMMANIAESFSFSRIPCMTVSRHVSKHVIPRSSITRLASAVKARSLMTPLLRMAAEVDSEGVSEETMQDFWIAAEDGNVARVSELIATGIAVDSVQTDDSYELSGLADRNRDQTSGGTTALHIASMFGHADLARMLLEKGASVASTTPESNTPLHVAVINQNKDVIRVLVEAGADADAENAFEESPKSIARMMNLSSDVLALLEGGK